MEHALLEEYGPDGYETEDPSGYYLNPTESYLVLACIISCILLAALCAAWQREGTAHNKEDQS